MTDLPGKAEFGGYLYICLFESGTVKIGVSTNPARRLYHHQHNGAAFGTPLIKWWLSPLHDDFFTSEKQVIELATSLGGVATHREYFVGVDFGELVEAAERLNYPKIDFEARRVEEQQSRERTREFWQSMLASTRPPVDRATWMADLVGQLFGRGPDGYSIPAIADGDGIPAALVQQMADLRGCSVGEILDMDYIDILEASATAVVRGQALSLRMYAMQSGRDDLTDPIFYHTNPE